MRKIIGLAIMLIYMFSASSLVHASTMGIFQHHTVNTDISNCHENTDTSKNKSTQQNMDCCELFTNYQYSQTKIEFEHQIKTFGSDQYIHILPNYTPTENTKISKHLIGFSPGQNTRSKYIKFADLFGIVVNIS
ncbi:MAG TPA: hypothetical protein PKC87_06415 [Candidatus Absconditabacterales bacterium]|nr:hypothetical protein [Candidatus Absconditabacterales bacterium]